MPVVTVTSSSAGVPAVSFTFNAANASGLSVAQQISNALQGAATPFPSGSSTLNVTTVNASGAAPTVSGGSTQELFISSVASSANVIAPSGYGYIVNNDGESPHSYQGGAKLYVWVVRSPSGSVSTATSPSGV